MWFTAAHKQKQKRPGLRCWRPFEVQKAFAFGQATSSARIRGDALNLLRGFLDSAPAMPAASTSAFFGKGPGRFKSFEKDSKGRQRNKKRHCISTASRYMTRHDMTREQITNKALHNTRLDDKTYHNTRRGDNT